jgi:putative SOS response-associated peptidase YedK
MCYHISFEVKLESVLDYFPDLIVDSQLEVEFPTAAYINGFDHGMHPVMLTGRKDGKKHLAQMMWGFLPNGVKNFEEAEKFWNGYKDENGKWNKGFITLNAVGEELFDKKLYSDAALNRRCVVFVDGFYEWHHYFPIGKKGQTLKTPIKYPHHIYLKDNPMPFFMLAAIWNPWRHEEVNKETGEIEMIVTPTFAISTTKANEPMGKIHNSKGRMPTILTKELAEEWIKDGLTQERITEIATYQYPAEQMGAHTIPRDFKEITTPKSKHVYPEFQTEFC